MRAPGSARRVRPVAPDSGDGEIRALLAAVEREAPEALALARWMADHPELSLAERDTSARYVSHLRERGFRVACPVADLDTAFVARRGAPSAPVRVALLAEMDALPGIGHACGHNLSGPASLLAASALASEIPEDDLEVVVIGTPAEETGVGKRVLVAAGVFDGIDCAMMAHAADMRRAHRLFLGNAKYEFVFRGRAAHAAAYPQDGINALDGVISLFVALGLLRQQLPSQVRVHGIVTDGGQAPNIIPERAAAVVWVRALDTDLLAATAQRVVQCARGAAEATGNALEIVIDANASPPMRVNRPLADLYRRQLQALGLEETPHAPDEAIGSSDVTHVSQALPTIHPNFPIGRDLELHTRAFAEATLSRAGEDGLLEAARALALTARAFARDPVARAAVHEAWAAGPP